MPCASGKSMSTDEKTMHGKKWRLLAHRPDSHLEIEDDGVLDELVLDDWLHLEQMDDNVWWLRVGDAHLLVTLGRGATTVDVVRGYYASVNGKTGFHEVATPSSVAPEPPKTK